jgi:hypothetical protein
MKTRLYEVEVPKYKTTAATSLVAHGKDIETLRKNALFNYNALRKINGLSPMKRMPNGTRYVPTEKVFS